MFILSIFEPWPRKWPKWTSKGLFWTFSGLGPGSGKNELQKARFEHFRSLAQTVYKMGLRRLILNMFGPWPRKWPNGPWLQKPRSTYTQIGRGLGNDTKHERRTKRGEEGNKLRNKWWRGQDDKQHEKEEYRNIKRTRKQRNKEDETKENRKRNN